MAEAAKRPKGWKLLKAALATRKAATMLAFGFSSGLPFALLIGTLNAWLGDAKINLATIGVLSWIGLGYAFKFLWSPLVDRRETAAARRPRPAKKLDRFVPGRPDHLASSAWGSATPRQTSVGSRSSPSSAPFLPPPRTLRSMPGASMSPTKRLRWSFCRQSTNSAIASPRSSAAPCAAARRAHAVGHRLSGHGRARRSSS